MKILIVRVGAMGDVLHALPAVAALRSARPDWQVDWVVDPRWAPLLVDAEGRGQIVNRVHVAETKAWSKSPAALTTVRSILELRRALRRERYDLVVDMQGTLRSAVIGWMAGAPEFAGYSDPRESLAASFYSRKLARYLPVSSGWPLLRPPTSAGSEHQERSSQHDLLRPGLRNCITRQRDVGRGQFDARSLTKQRRSLLDHVRSVAREPPRVERCRQRFPRVAVSGILWRAGHPADHRRAQRTLHVDNKVVALSPQPSAKLEDRANGCQRYRRLRPLLRLCKVNAVDDWAATVSIYQQRSPTRIDDPIDLPVRPHTA